MKTLPCQALAKFNTLGIAARAARVVEIDRASDLAGIEFDPARDLVLGGGSNVILAADVPGAVYLVRLKGRRKVEENSRSITVEAAAGEDWHELVRWSVERGLGGLENLSLIPGLVGAAPLQNIGAYGVELSDCLRSVEAWDWKNGTAVTLAPGDCAFGYRDSRFKSVEPDRFLILSLRLRLERSFQPRLDYPGLAAELGRRNTGHPSPVEVSDAVIALRRRKLPDPARIGNAGSFFKNPVVGAEVAERLRRKFPQLPLHAVSGAGMPPGAAKASAAWMIEHCGWKGHRQGDAGVSDRHALVLVNHGEASGRQILALAERVRKSVRETFGVALEIEPRVVGVAGDEAGPARRAASRIPS